MLILLFDWFIVIADILTAAYAIFQSHNVSMQALDMLSFLFFLDKHYLAF